MFSFLGLPDQSTGYGAGLAWRNPNPLDRPAPIHDHAAINQRNLEHQFACGERARLYI